MKILKNIVVALAIILVIAAIGIYFLPKEYKVANSIEINQPVSVVYAELNDFSKWGAWDPWKEMDPNSKATFEGAPGTKGHKMSWQGEKTGEGSMTLDWCENNKSICSDLDFVKPFKAQAKDMWQLEATGDKTTKVTWINSGGLKYPFGRLFGLSVDKMMDKEHTKGLNNLKKYCESLPAPQAEASADTTVAKASM